jgi:hypothetical protein
MKTAKEILFSYRVQSSPFTEDKMIEAMEEYASQRSELTDEEIEKEFPIDLKVKGNSLDISNSTNIDKRIGAKWARDRQKGGKI